MSVPEVGAVVVGGGIAGLAAALELDTAHGEVVLIDAGDRPGGVLRTDHVSGYVVERGPNTFQVKAPMRSFLERHRLREVLREATPESRRRLLYRDGALVPVPLSPLSLLRTPLLSAKGKARLLLEPLLPRRDAGRESVAEFLGRRLGREAVTGLVGPFLTGVYAGDEEELGAEAVFPGLVELERRHRSLALGALAGALGRRGERGLRGSYSAVEGLGPLARRLSGLLREPPALGTSVARVRRDGGTWRVETTGPGGDRALRAERVVVATAAPEAAALLREESPEIAGDLDSVRYAPVVSVALGADPAEAREPIDGFGFLVPRAAGLDLLGCLFMSRLFPNRAPERRELLQCMLGGARDPGAVDRPDDVLREGLLRDLERTLGLRAEPEMLAVSRWRRAIPQPDRHHVRRMRRVRERLRERPGLALAGAYWGGVAVPDALASGVDAAREVSA